MSLNETILRADHAGVQPESDSLVTDDRKTSPLTYALTGAAHVAGAAAGYNHLTKLWGLPDGRFHFKDEVHDGLAFNDEVSHVFISYKLYQGLSSGYRCLGFSERTSRFLGVIESALIMTAVEFPLDAYNPAQGFGVTDLAANYAGIGLALWKHSDTRLNDFDLKISIKTFSAQPAGVLAESAHNYDNYIYWLTFRFRFAVFGAGYSTCRRSDAGAEPQLFLGIGTTVPDLLRSLSPKMAGYLEPLGLYFLNLRLRAL